MIVCQWPRHEAKVVPKVECTLYLISTISVLLNPYLFTSIPLDPYPSPYSPWSLFCPSVFSILPFPHHFLTFHLIIHLLTLPFSYYFLACLPIIHLISPFSSFHHLSSPMLSQFLLLLPLPLNPTTFHPPNHATLRYFPPHSHLRKVCWFCVMLWCFLFREVHWSDWCREWISQRLVEGPAHCELTLLQENTNIQGEKVLVSWDHYCEPSSGIQSECSETRSKSCGNHLLEW